MAIEQLKTVLRLQATVVEGFGRGGKQLGCPTANLSSKDLGDLLEQLPTGIYCGWATVDGKGPYKAVASIGWNPYFKNKVRGRSHCDGGSRGVEEKTVEPHLLHKFEKDFYGAQLKFLITGYIRPEMNFSSLESLIKAIQDDIAQSKEWLDTPEGKSWSQDALFQ
ncbi:hypothetical protein PHYPSEUDO_010367 [Phytophthora pseudosyringae]|uniref:Riboflavin kinase domain-containing protein n=1 Tax=Phytophthora pseudosyringae TaxID=221518 RepID=A0A8T1W682_9STRA|nr:hypothetical protein PHYPSEUDO_010367 [Phytophthora pseudosyringae]